MSTDAEANRLINALLEARAVEPWRFSFRASAMPACQLQHVWFAMDEHLKDIPRRNKTYFSDFFLEVGTAVHTATQRWLGRLGILFGNWMCESCGRDDKGVPINMIADRFGPQKCSTHKTEMVYEEYEFNDPPTGHCDGLIKFGEMTPNDNDFVLLELKTSSTKKIDTEIKPNGPPMSYKIQATIYAHKLKKRGFNIVGVLFIFIPRDIPRGMYPVWFKPSRPTAVHESLIAAHTATLEALKTGDFSTLSGTCVDPSDARDCPYRVNCFSPVSGDLLTNKCKQFFGDRPVNLKLPILPSSYDTGL